MATRPMRQPQEGPEETPGMLSVFFVNNAGGGFADNVEVPDGTTLKAFLDAEVPDLDEESRQIRVNRDVAPADYVLREGDRVSCVPRKIDMARR